MNTDQDKSIINKKKSSLFVCLSKTWGMRERSLIKDAEIAKEKGYNPIIFCLEDSFLDIYAKKKKINVMHNYSKIQNSFLKWYRYRNLSSFISGKKVNFIHCYDFKMIWPICFFLRKHRMTPLFLTLDQEFSKTYLKIWHKTLLSRIDHIFVHAHCMVEEVQLKLGIFPRKVTVLGYGVETKEIEKTEINNLKKKLGMSRNSLTVGSLISFRLKTIDPILPLIYGITGYNQKYLDRPNLRLILISERQWNKALIYQDLIRFIKDAGCEDDILFYSGDSIELFQSAIDLWLCSYEGSHFSDYAVKSLLFGVPILAPRNSGAMEFFTKFQNTGEAYRRQDSFDIREKLAKIALNKKSYLKKISDGQKNILELHSLETYKGLLSRRYLKVVNARSRAASRKKKRIK